MKIYFSLFIVLLLAAGCKPRTQPPGKKIEEKSMLLLGGENQYVEITGENDAAPVLLFIHGGPGWPQTPMLRYFNSELTKKYIVVSWDQRGCGKSYMNNPNPGNMTLQQVVSDAHELTAYLKKKFGDNRSIYLAGFSWGSIVGMELAQKYPRDYEAYIAISQVISLSKGTQVAREWLEEEAKKANDTATLNTIAKLNAKDTSFCKSELDCFLLQSKLVSKYKGDVYNDTMYAAEEKAMKAYDDYKDYDWMKGFEFSARHFEKDMFAADFSGVGQLEIPVYFLAGKNDWQVPSIITQAFYDNFSAPEKKIFWFKNTGHNIPEEAAAEFNDILVHKILKQ